MYILCHVGIGRLESKVGTGFETNGNGKTVWVMLQGLIQTLLVRLPFAYYMSIQPDASLTNIGLAAPISTAVGIVLNVAFFLYLEHAAKRS